jgi:hypothetical protein
VRSHPFPDFAANLDVPALYTEIGFHDQPFVMIRADLVHEGANRPEEKWLLLCGLGDLQECADELSPGGGISDAPRLQQVLDGGKHFGAVFVEQRPQSLASLLFGRSINDAVVYVERNVRDPDDTAAVTSRKARWSAQRAESYGVHPLGFSAITS